MGRKQLVRDALDVWAPTWPRRVTRYQEWADTPELAVDELLFAEDNEHDEPFISTYAFPRGHTSGGNIPDVDTLFIDFDMESGTHGSWEQDLSFLLVRARRVAAFLLDRSAVGWRASLSGHKGVHLFLDFPRVPPTTGSFEHFIAGVNEYARELVGHLVQETSISDLSDYVDVTSSDLGRLHRVPNTRHGRATERFGEPRYCVPVTLEELAEITVEDYESLTQEARAVPYDGREPNEEAGDVIRQHVATATPTAYSRHLGQPSFSDFQKYQEYVTDVQNEAIELEDVKFLTRDRPCVWEFHEREDKFDYGMQSHYAEMFCIRELQEKNVPVDVMKEFLSNSRDYNEDYSDSRIKEIISRDYNRFSVRRLIENAPEFANPDSCRICKRAAQDVKSTHV